MNKEEFMNANIGGSHERNQDAASDIGQGEATRRIATPNELADEIEILEGQIAILEEGYHRRQGCSGQPSPKRSPRTGLGSLPSGSHSISAAAAVPRQ
jgi:hypothetical protein